MAHQSVFIAWKWKILHFFKNDTPSQSKITSVFAPFGSLTEVVSDSKFFSKHQLVSFMSSELLYEVIALQQRELECLKTHQTLCRTVWKKKLDFKNFRIHHHFWSPWGLQKKLFLKSQQLTSNPNSEWSKLHMTKLWICFGFYMIRAFDW